ncbi:MAG: hypothetical protein A2007_06465 [Verrucomicrobia bacterium GWC2_42_7]|nr:MAG: hypothetical protein A2007_06465 [Verrucomicrobia bacterium GWC2_42_7]
MVLALQDILIQYRDRKVLDEISWQIGDGERYGLVGMNGSGKTTLLKVLTNNLVPDKGLVQKSKDCSIGYLPQDIEPIKGMTLYQAAETAFISHNEIESNLRCADLRLQELDPNGEEYRRLLHRIAEWEQQLHHHEHIPARIEKVLLGLGFKREQFSQDVSFFSGGWQTRILMARLLLENPSLLLLDEPTNHLDLTALCWFEDFLKKYTGAYVIVSHDRRFLNNLCEKIAYIDQGQLSIWNGNYEKFEEEMANRIEQQEAAFQSQQKEVQRIQAFIDRFRYKATKAAQVQSRIKMLDKVEKLSVPETQKHVAFGFPPAPDSGTWMINLEKMSHAYGPKQILTSVSLKVERPDRIAIVGANGEGKSTLLRLLAQIESIQQGTYYLGHKVVLSYFSQQQAEHWLENDTVLEAMQKVAPPSMGEGKIRSILGAFLFTKDDAFKPISALSGGERARLKLAAMLLKGSNCLLLDEPTNHLDMIAKDRLQQALLEYQGSLVIVSHDRDFLEPLVNRVWEVKDKQVNVFHGSISYYIQKSQDQFSEKKFPAPTKKTPQKTQKATTKVSLEKTEEQIVAIESQLHQLNIEMQQPDFFANPTSSQKLALYKKLESQLEGLWASLER